MFKIGEFSRLTWVPVKTLRYYDELGLLKPVEVDPFTSYRYYSASQLPRLNRILVLKDLGLTLEQIRLILEEDLTAEQLRGMLYRRQAELRQQIEEGQEMLARVESRLQQIDLEGRMTTMDVVIKRVPPMWVASVRGVIASYPEQGALWNELETALRLKGLKPNGACFTIYHDEEYVDRNINAEVCEPVDGPAELSGRARIYELPGCETMACYVYHGPFNGLSNAYSELLTWLSDNGYQISGVGREIYVHTGSGVTRQDDPAYITEIQFPVTKA